MQQTLNNLNRHCEILSRKGKKELGQKLSRSTAEMIGMQKKKIRFPIPINQIQSRREFFLKRIHIVCQRNVTIS